MRNSVKTKSAAVRERLNHPVIDGDGHMVEYIPAVLDYLRETGGVAVMERYRAGLESGGQNFDGGTKRIGASGWYGATPDERRDRRLTRPSFWHFPVNALDRATVMLPNLLRERLDDLGIDFTVVYPSFGLYIVRHPDDEIRLAGCRALNRMFADIYLPHKDRMTPAACIPMVTPTEAIEELEYAVGTLGLKTIMITGCVRRPVPKVAREAADLAQYATWIDPLGHGSQYDYDPFWKRCVELKVAPTSHSGSIGWGARTSTQSHMYNHIGHFAAASEAFCKALVIGGVTKRFPTLNFGFLEGGVGWASSLFNDLIEHWEKRHGSAMDLWNPANIDSTALRGFFETYGGVLMENGRIDAMGSTAGEVVAHEQPGDIDEWAHLGITKERDFYDLFVPRFFFGCEADDRMVAVAVNPKLHHFGAKLQPIFSSDFGHWDVPDITEVVAEAYDLVEDGVLLEEDFRDFTFTNPVKLQSANPDFFTGTVVEDAVRSLR